MFLRQGEEQRIKEWLRFLHNYIDSGGGIRGKYGVVKSSRTD